MELSVYKDVSTHSMGGGKGQLSQMGRGVCSGLCLKLANAATIVFACVE